MRSRAITFRLCVMMFLEYAVRGMWYPYFANYLRSPRSSHGLGFSSGQTGWILGFANALGAFTAPMIAGQVADRFFNAEKALALLHLLAAILLFANASSTEFLPFFCIMICFSIAYVPTQSLANSLALSHLSDREHSYPRVRMWGTIGWITTSALFTFVVLRSSDHTTNIARIPWAMRAAAMTAVCYAAYAFFALPATPPVDDAAPFKPAGVLKERSALVLLLIALPIAAIHTAYYLNIGPFLSSSVGVPLRFVGPALAIAQLSEVLFLFALGPLLKRFGYRAVLAAGAAAQALRFAIFALNLPAPIEIAALSLHGIAFACFFATAILYFERIFPPSVRHSAQTVVGVALFGLGPALAGPYSELFDRSNPGSQGFGTIWWTQAAIALASALLIVLFFWPKQPARDVVKAGAAEIVA